MSAEKKIRVNVVLQQDGSERRSLFADTGLLSEGRSDSSTEVGLGGESSDRPLAGKNVSIEEGGGLLEELGRVSTESECFEET